MRWRGDKGMERHRAEGGEARGREVYSVGVQAGAVRVPAPAPPPHSVFRAYRGVGARRRANRVAVPMPPPLCTRYSRPRAPRSARLVFRLLGTARRPFRGA